MTVTEQDQTSSGTGRLTLSSFDAVVVWSGEVVLEHGEDYISLCDVATGIFGVGPDLSSASEDLTNALREHLDVLERQEALSPDLEAQLEHLRKRFK